MRKMRILSFKHAFEGIWIALKDEPNLKFHFFAAFLVFGLGWYLKISPIEWTIILLTIGMVVSLELTNTAIEEIINSFTDKEHPSAKKAKDVAAGAVLIASITALAVGTFIFVPLLIHF